MCASLKTMKASRLLTYLVSIIQILFPEVRDPPRVKYSHYRKAQYQTICPANHYHSSSIWYPANSETHLL